MAAKLIGEAIEPFLQDAARREGYRRLLPQKSPVEVMNVRGASASGKSSMRPRQKILAKNSHCLGKSLR